MKKYSMFDHTADMGVEITGLTRKELFKNAADALFDILIEGKDHAGDISGRRKKTLIIEGADIADLLINYFRELLYLFNGNGWVVDHCAVTKCSNKRLMAELMIKPYDQKKHSIKAELKAVTYHGLSVEKIKSGWKARVIFDV